MYISRVHDWKAKLEVQYIYTYRLMERALVDNRNRQVKRCCGINLSGGLSHFEVCILRNKMLFFRIGDGFSFISR